MKNIKTVYFALLLPFILNASEVLPLESSQWQSLRFGSIPPNLVRFENQIIAVDVAESAGPIVYPIPRPSMLSSIKIVGEWKGSKIREKGRFDEDSVFRLGLVVQGDEVLTWARQLIAADWVKKLFSLAPKGEGIEAIYFYNLSNRSELLGKSRIHPMSNLIHEKIEWIQETPSEFELELILPPQLKSKKILAFWLSIDGDDTRSRYHVDIKKISYTLFK